jgi:hypothetical protein
LAAVALQHSAEASEKRYRTEIATRTAKRKPAIGDVMRMGENDVLSLYNTHVAACPEQVGGMHLVFTLSPYQMLPGYAAQRV